MFKEKIVIISGKAYNIRKTYNTSKTYNSNSTKDRWEKIEVYCCKILPINWCNII